MPAWSQLANSFLHWWIQLTCSELGLCRLTAVCTFYRDLIVTDIRETGAPFAVCICRAIWLGCRPQPRSRRTALEWRATQPREEEHDGDLNPSSQLSSPERRSSSEWSQ